MRSSLCMLNTSSASKWLQTSDLKAQIATSFVHVTVFCQYQFHVVPFEVRQRLALSKLNLHVQVHSKSTTWKLPVSHGSKVNSVHSKSSVAPSHLFGKASFICNVYIITCHFSTSIDKRAAVTIKHCQSFPFHIYNHTPNLTCLLKQTESKML